VPSIIQSYPESIEQELIQIKEIQEAFMRVDDPGSVHAEDAPDVLGWFDPIYLDEAGRFETDWPGRPAGAYVDGSGRLTWDPHGKKSAAEAAKEGKDPSKGRGWPMDVRWDIAGFPGDPIPPLGPSPAGLPESDPDGRDEALPGPDQRGFLDWERPTRPTAARFAQRRDAEDPPSAPKAKTPDAKPLSKDAQRLLDRRPPAAQGLSGSTFAQLDLPGGGFSGGGGMDRLAGGLGGAQGRALSDRLTARAKEIGADMRNARKDAPGQGEGKRDPKDSAAGRRADALIGSDDYWRNETKQREVRGLFEEMYGEKTKPHRDPKDSAAGRRADALIGSDDYWRNDA